MFLFVEEYAGIFFFFFQAEDGIRDYKVTGVQTCALPIYRDPHQAEREEAQDPERREGAGLLVRVPGARPRDVAKGSLHQSQIEGGEVSREREEERPDGVPLRPHGTEDARREDEPEEDAEHPPRRGVERVRRQTPAGAAAASDLDPGLYRLNAFQG